VLSRTAGKAVVESPDDDEDLKVRDGVVVSKTVCNLKMLLVVGLAGKRKGA
jgi:hypothetical protein